MSRTVLNHAYYVYLRAGLAELVRQGLIESERTIGRMMDRFTDIAFRRSVAELREKMDAERTVEDIISTPFEYRGVGVYRSIEPFQHKPELLALLETLDRVSVDSVLEIGTARGGTLYLWCRAFDNASAFVSVDLPGGEFGGGYSQSRMQFFREFAPNGRMDFIRRDSHDQETKAEVEAALSGESVDFLFIDADHTYEGVKQDFEMYSPLVGTGGVAVLHDICGNPSDPDVGVDQYWQELREYHNTEEIVGTNTQQWGGFGLVYL